MAGTEIVPDGPPKCLPHVEQGIVFKIHISAGGSRVRQSGAARGRCRSRRLLVRDSVRQRPAGPGMVSASDLCAAAFAVTGNHRGHRPRSCSIKSRAPRTWAVGARRSRRGRPPRTSSVEGRLYDLFTAARKRLTFFAFLPQSMRVSRNLVALRPVPRRRRQRQGSRPGHCQRHRRQPGRGSFSR